MIAETDPFKWIPAAALAGASVFAILRVVIRYDRVFVKDAGKELQDLRAEMVEVRTALAHCVDQHREAESKISALTNEVAWLRRQVET